MLVRGLLLPWRSLCHSAPTAAVRGALLYNTASHGTENDIYQQQAAPTLLGDVVTALLEHGRGVVARHSISAGDLIVCVQPAAILQGSPDEQPEPELLVPALMEAAQQPHVLAAVRCLFDGSDSSKQQLPDLKTLAMQGSGSVTDSSCCNHDDHRHHHDHHHHHDHQHGSSNDVNGSSSCGSGSAPAPLLTAEQAAYIVKYNAFGDDFEDLAAAAVRGAACPSSHVGCWPAFAMFNHSCAPNTVHYVVDRSMVVRATEDVAAGHEVTVSYLGREDFAPVGARQAVLQERFGFTCECMRCRLEQQAPQQLQQLIEHLFRVVHQEIKPAFLQAIEAQDSSSLAQVHTALSQLEDQLSRALQQHIAALSPSAVLVLQAAVYDLFELLLFCEQLGSGSVSEVAHRSLTWLGRCIAIINCLAQGSELHVYLTSRMLQHVVDLRGPDSVQAEAAATLVQEAHLLRYGKQLESSLMMQLMEANKQAAQEFLM